ncbi:MAG: hypothetical protein ACK4FR_10970 [Tabrizicola sp.]
MLTRPLALAAALAIVASLFLPWNMVPFGEGVAPWSILRDMDAARAQEILSGARFETIALYCSFVLGASFVLLALFGHESRLLAMLTGLVPVALVAWALMSLAGQTGATGLPASGWALPETGTTTMGVGFWAWAAGASLLATLGVLDPGRRPAYR